MSRSITGKAVDRFVDVTNDRHYNAHLFASHILAEDRHTQTRFFDTIVCYLQLLARHHQFSNDYASIQDIAKLANVMYSAYLESGGVGEPILPDLNRFDYTF